MNISVNPFTALNLSRANQSFKEEKSQEGDSGDIYEPLSYIAGDGTEMVGICDGSRKRWVPMYSDEWTEKRQKEMDSSKACGDIDY